MKLKSCMSLAIGLSLTLTAVGESILLECEQFKDRGGWSVDSQFIDEMDSSYLLAHGLGKPVADASTTFEVKKGGTYNVFVRTKNWTSKWSPALGAGRFNLIVNGEKLPNLLGVQGKGEWLWVKADDVTLKAGTNTLALHDVSGFDGRCDAIVLSTEKVDSSFLKRLGSRFSAAITNNQQPTTNNFSHDLVVVGGGIAGICTAISAARLGLKVALVQDRPVLGGANSSEVRVHLGGYQNLGPYPRLGDVVSEIGPAKGGNAQPAAQYEDDRKLAAVKAEKNIALYLNTRVVAVEKVKVEGEGEPRRIQSVVGRDVVTGKRTSFAAPLFADCTGDGCVGYLAGADWRLGRESKAETGEKDALDVADKQTLGASCQWYAERIGGKFVFPSEPWMIRFNEEAVDYKLRGDWDWETGMNRDQLNDFETVRDYAMLVAYSNWNHVKNIGPRKAEFADAELVWLAYVAGKRETRRLLGDHILTYDDVFEERPYPDGTCCTTWAIDLHYPMPANERNYDGEPFRSICTHDQHYAYPIPYRCFYSRNVPNLFMAGRDISVTHVALGTTRVMRTHGMMGEVVGMAASICKKRGCDPRGVYEEHLDDLKSLMTKGVGLGKPQPPQDYNLGAIKRGLTFDRKSVMVDGRRTYLISGEFHYFRVPKKDWRKRLELLKGVGGNCVATYVPWCIHEEKEGEIRFGDVPHRDLESFLRLVKEMGLLAIVRPGPYQYSELVNAGLPRWLIEGHPEILKKKPDGTNVGPDSVDYNHPYFLEKTRAYFKEVAKVLSPHMSECGGPIALVQLDNELTGIHVWAGYQPDEKYYAGCADYLETLKGYLREGGILGPYCHNSGGATMTATYATCVEKLGTRDFLLGYDHYYGLFQAEQEAPGPYYFLRALFACDMLKDFGYPPIGFEIQCGTFGDVPPILREDALCCYMLNLAAGMKGINYYVFTGGPNVPGTGATADIYDYQAPVAADGTVRPTYVALKEFGAFVAAHPTLVAAPRLTSVRLGVEWQLTARLRDRPCYDIDFSRSGMQYALLQTPYSPAYCLLRDPIPLDGKPLVLAGVPAMSPEAQQRVAGFVLAGGSLLVAPDFPREDLFGKPCTILAEAVGAPSLKKVAVPPASPRIDVAGVGVYGLSPQVEAASGEYERQWTAGKGRVAWLGCTWKQMRFSQAEMVGAILSALGAKPVVTSSNRNVFTTAYALSNGKTGVFALNLRPGVQETTLSVEGKPASPLSLTPFAVGYREF